MPRRGPPRSRVTSATLANIRASLEPGSSTWFRSGSPSCWSRRSNARVGRCSADCSTTTRSATRIRRDIEIGYPRKTRDWPPIDLDHPESWFEMLHEAHVGKYRRKGQWSSKRVAERVPFLFSMQLQRTIFETRGREREREQRARRPRLLLHLLFQRVAGQPQPVHRPEEGRHRLRSAADPGPRPDRAILRRLSGRNAHHHRAESLRLVRVVPGSTAAVTTTSKAHWGCGVGRPWPPSRRTGGAPSASSSSCTRPSCATPRPPCAASPIGSGSPCLPRCSFPRSTAGRSLPTRASKSWDEVFSQSAPRPGGRASTRPTATRIEVLSDDLYERAQGIAQS